MFIFYLGNMFTCLTKPYKRIRPAQSCSHFCPAPLSSLLEQPFSTSFSLPPPCPARLLLQFFPISAPMGVSPTDTLYLLMIYKISSLPKSSLHPLGNACYRVSLCNHKQVQICLPVFLLPSTKCCRSPPGSPVDGELGVSRTSSTCEPVTC